VTAPPSGAVLLATRNPAKLAELRRVLAAYAGSAPDVVPVVGVEEVAAYPDVAETAATFTGNALLKARAGAVASGLLTVADDSGLCVDALGGMPGILSARWSGRHGDDAANLALLLGQLADVTRRDAAFVCAAAAVTPEGRELSVVATMRGSLTTAPRGAGGFGYDPIFVPAGDTRTTAEMTPEEKDAISHRGKAFRALAPLLAPLLMSDPGSAPAR